MVIVIVLMGEKMQQVMEEWKLFLSKTVSVNTAQLGYDTVRFQDYIDTRGHYFRQVL
jgi:exonuclease I